MDPAPPPAPDDSPKSRQGPPPEPAPDEPRDPSPGAPLDPTRGESTAATGNEPSADEDLPAPESFLILPDELPAPPAASKIGDGSGSAREAMEAAAVVPEDFLLFPDETPEPEPTPTAEDAADLLPGDATAGGQDGEDELPHFPEITPPDTEGPAEPSGGDTATAGPEAPPPDTSPARPAIDESPSPQSSEPETAETVAETRGIETPPLPAIGDDSEAPPQPATESGSVASPRPTPAQATQTLVAGLTGALARAGTAIRRRPRAFLTTAAVVAVLSWLLVILARQQSRVNDALTRTRAAEKRAESESALRLQAEDTAARSVRIAAFFTDLLKGVGPSVASGRDTALLRELIEKSVLRMKSEFSAHPQVEGEISQALSQIAFELGDHPRAESLARRALDLRQAALGESHPGVLFAKSHLAAAALRNGRAAEAESLLREVVAARRASLGEAHPEIATLNLNLSVALRHQGKFEEAEKLARLGLEIRRGQPATPTAELLGALTNLADLLLQTGRLAEAESVAREAVEIHARSTPSPVPDADLSALLTKIAAVLRQRQDLVGAERVMRDALDIRLRILGEDDLNAAWSQSQLAMVQMHQGRYRDAEPLMRAALDTRRKLLGERDRLVLESLNNLGAILLGLGKLEAAEASFQQALALGRATLGQKSEIVTNLVNSLAVVQARRGNHTAAAAGFREALTLQREALGGEHPQVISTLENLARVLEMRKEIGEAATVWRDLVAATRKAPGSDPVARVRAAMDAGAFFCRQQMPADAEPLLRDCLASLSRDEPGGWRRFAVEAMLGGSLMEQGRLAEAQAPLESGCRGLERLERELPPEGLGEIPIALHRLARLGTLLGRPADQVSWMGRLGEFYARHPSLRRAATPPRP